MTTTTHHIDMRCDGPRRPPPPLSRRDAMRMGFERAEARVHRDARVRAELLVDIEEQIGRLTLLRADAHAVCGRRPGALDDQSLTTAELRVALDLLRKVPTPWATPSMSSRDATDLIPNRFRLQ